MSKYACENCGRDVNDGAVLHRTSPKGELFRGKCSVCLGREAPRDMGEALMDALTPIGLPVDTTPPAHAPGDKHQETT